MPLGAISVPTLLYNYWYHISLQPWLFLGHLRGAEVSPKRDITERPVLYFKPNTPTVLNRVKQATLWILLFQVWGERAALRAGPAPFVLLHVSFIGAQVHLSNFFTTFVHYWKATSQFWQIWDTCPNSPHETFYIMLCIIRKSHSLFTVFMQNKHI